MRLDIGDMPVTLRGVQRIYLLGETHVGALVDDESGYFVIGPVVEGRDRDLPLDAPKYASASPGDSPIIPTFAAMSDDDYATVIRVLEGVASRLGVPFRHGYRT